MARLSLAGIPSQSSEAGPGQLTALASLPRTWSPQQQAIFDLLSSPSLLNLMIEAVAGSGKTTTLVEICRLLSLQGRSTVAFLAYNKKIADEIKFRTSSFPSVSAGTFHSFGFAAWRAQVPRCKVEGKKLWGIQDELNEDQRTRQFTSKLVSILKGAGENLCTAEVMSNYCDHFDLWDLLPLKIPSTEAFVSAAKLLHESNLACHEGLIDFDDMLYAPLTFNAPFPKYDWVLVDEAQDTNTARREIAKRMLKPGGRLIAVGDPHQAIYGFTGADSDSLHLISTEFKCHPMPLTVSYRCPKAVVEHAQQWVSHIQAAEGAPEGVVRTMPNHEFLRLTKEDLKPGVALLCRYTRPLISLAYDLVARKIPCRVEGRDIGQNLIQLAGRWKGEKDCLAIEAKMDAWEQVEINKLLSAKKDYQAESVQDRCASVRIIISHLDHRASFYDLKRAIEELFVDTEPGKSPTSCVLSTVHKSKGREWDTVYLLFRDTMMPARRATQEWQLEQEKNLIYVAITRAKHTLIEVQT